MDPVNEFWIYCDIKATIIAIVLKLCIKVRNDDRNAPVQDLSEKSIFQLWKGFIDGSRE